MYYINRRTKYGVETVDEFETHKEALAMLYEHGMSDWSADYYISTRCTKDWKDR